MVLQFEDRVCSACGSSWQALAMWERTLCGECARVARTAELAAYSATRAYVVTELGGACPTQAQGVTAGGDRFYFRARHGEWALWVDPVDAVRAVEPVAQGEDPAGGWMSDDEVLAVLDAHL